MFHDQIEIKQKELQPWTAKINAKQAEIDVASSERDALVKKAEALEVARQEAQDTLQGLNSDHVVKVSFPLFSRSVKLSDVEPIFICIGSRVREAQGFQG